jgi:HK97 family phage major capsid protein
MLTGTEVREDGTVVEHSTFDSDGYVTPRTAPENRIIKSIDLEEARKELAAAEAAAEANPGDKTLAAEALSLRVKHKVATRQAAHLIETRGTEDDDDTPQTVKLNERERAIVAQDRADAAKAEKREVIREARESATRVIPPERVTFGAEEHTYRKGGEFSYFSDLYAAKQTGSPAAIERLQRNNREVASESRAALTTSDFYPPQFLSDQYVTTMRPRLVYAALVQQLALPPSGETVTIPKYTAPADAAAFQAGDNQAVQSSAGTSSQLTAPIASAAGYLDVARQSIERAIPGLDEVVLSDISRDIGRKIEVACLNGSGSNQPKGVLQESGVPSVTVGAQTAVQFLLKLADLMQRIEIAVGEPADFVCMHPRRWSWLESLVDSNNRPLVVPAGQGPFNSFGTFNPQGEQDGLSLSPDVTPLGYIAGLPIYTSSAMPSATGAGTNEDPVLVGVRSLACRWADPQGIRNFAFEGVVSSTASVRLMGFTYSSYITRYPTAFGIIAGLTTPSF